MWKEKIREQLENDKTFFSITKPESKYEEEESTFEEDCIITLAENKHLGLLFPSRSAENSPRSKIVIFQITEEMIEKYPKLRPILTPVTSTNASVFIVEPVYLHEDQSKTVENLSVQCNCYVIYGNSIEKQSVPIEQSLEAFEAYISSSLKVYPFTAELKINKENGTINNMSGKEFIEFVTNLYQSE